MIRDGHDSRGSDVSQISAGSLVIAEERQDSRVSEERQDSQRSFGGESHVERQSSRQSFGEERQSSRRSLDEPRGGKASVESRGSVEAGFGAPRSSSSRGWEGEESDAGS